MEPARNPRQYQEIKGNLIELAKTGQFDVIAHGCNCMCTMGAGIAPQMAKAFGANSFRMESNFYKGDYNKLGQIDIGYYILESRMDSLPVGKADQTLMRNLLEFCNPVMDEGGVKLLYVVNAYTQFNYGKNHADGSSKPLDYTALKLCLKKMNYRFKGLKIGLPKIGCGLAGGDWARVKYYIEKYLCDCYVTIVTLP